MTAHVNPSRLLTLLLTLGLAATLTACGGETDPEENNGGGDGSELTNPFAGEATAITEGEQAYLNSDCSGCHGTDGKNEVFRDLSTVNDKADGVLFVSIRDGIDGTSMNSYGGRLDEDQIWKMVTWIKTIE
jgi:mono/diheme cytochrome c family protein